MNNKYFYLDNFRNEQEFVLLEEKHREEMELCKIRLGNATKIIAQLEQELSVYRAKRCENIYYLLIWDGLIFPIREFLCFSSISSMYYIHYLSV